MVAPVDNLPDMSREISTALQALMGAAPGLRVPELWLVKLPSQSAALVLADILAAYVKAHDDGGRGDCHLDGDELLLEYKSLAKRLGLNARTVSRCVDALVKAKAIRYNRRDRVIHGTPTRNVVGVVPNIQAIAKLSRTMRVGAPTSPAAVTNLELTPSQESIVRAYEDHFGDLTGKPYNPSPNQRIADHEAVSKLNIDAGRGGARKFLASAPKYLAALNKEAKRDHGDIRQAAFDRAGHVKDRYTIESFLASALRDDLLAGGLPRRSFK